MLTLDEVFNGVGQATERVAELYRLIRRRADIEPSLAELYDNDSAYAEHTLWQYVYAAVAHAQQLVWLDTKQELGAMTDNIVSGTDRWLQNELFKFQMGQPLLFDDATGKYFYASDNPGARIIKRVAVASRAGLTTAKVAGESGGLPVALAPEELQAFRFYIDRIKWAGSNIDAVSFNADTIQVNATVWYDGLLAVDGVRTAVERAVNNYLANLEFDGQLGLTKLQDAMQAVGGVVDVRLASVLGRPDQGGFDPIERVYFPISGYIQIDPGHKLSDTILYKAQ